MLYLQIKAYLFSINNNYDEGVLTQLFTIVQAYRDGQFDWRRTKYRYSSENQMLPIRCSPVYVACHVYEL
jgi:hypothetical protein